MKTMKLTFLAATIAITSFFGNSLQAEELKKSKANKKAEAKMQMEAQQMIQTLQVEVFQKFLEREALQDFQIEQEVKVSVIGLDEKQVYEGKGESLEAKKMILQSDFINQVNRIRYYLLTR